MRRLALLAISACLAAISLVVKTHANGLSQGEVCEVGGYHYASVPVILPFADQILTGASRWKKDSKNEGVIRVLNLAAKKFTEVDNLPIVLRSVETGAVIGGSVFVGGDNGLLYTSDLKHWESVRRFEGEHVQLLVPVGDSVWIGTPRKIFVLKKGRVVSEFVHSEDRITSLRVIDGKMRYSGVREIEPPTGFCKPYFTVDGEMEVDSASGKSKSIKFAERISTFPNRWLSMYSFRPNAKNEFGDTLEALYSEDGYFPSWEFWNEVFDWLIESGDGERLKRMYLSAKKADRLHLLKNVGYRDGSLSFNILTLAVDQRDYFYDELARTIDRHKGEEFDGLLKRMLVEGASMEPESIGKNIAVPYPCGPCGAASAILERNIPDGVELIEKVAEDPTTNPIVRKSLEHRLRFSNRGSQPPYKLKRHVRAEKAQGPEAVKLLDDADPYVRFQAIQHLRQTPDLVPFPKLISLLSDTNDVAAYATMAITASKNEGADSALLAAVKSEKIPVKVWAMIGIGQRKISRGYADLVGGLGDQNADIRSAAARGLGDLGDRRALSKLRAVIDDQNYDVRTNSAEAIRKIESKP